MNAPTTVNELIALVDIRRNAGWQSSAAINLLDMIDEGSLDPNDGARIAELFKAHRP